MPAADYVSCKYFSIPVKIAKKMVGERRTTCGRISAPFHHGQPPKTWTAGSRQQRHIKCPETAIAACSVDGLYPEQRFLKKVSHGRGLRVGAEAQFNGRYPREVKGAIHGSRHVDVYWQNAAL